MKNKIIFFSILVLVQCLRALILKFENKNGRYLLISFFLISIPFHFAFPLYSPDFITPAGTLSTRLYITIPIILLFTIWPFLKFNMHVFNFKSNTWIIAVLFLTALSLFNPVIPSKYLVCIFLVFFVSHILFFQLVLRGFSQAEIIKGIYDGLFFLCIFQFFLAICWPFLHITAVTTLFHDVGERTATRMGSRPGAIGFFVHPGSLALFTIISLVFFQSCYFNNYNKQKSVFIFFISAVTLVLTFSRTSWLVCTIDLIFIYFIYRNAHKALFTLSNFFKFVVPTLLALAWLVFLSPLSSTFLNSDSGAQYENRMIHWQMALESFSKSPLLGVGINSHLEYFSKNFYLFNSMIITDPFFWQNPIHNIHLLILTETGLVGLILWFVFAVTNIGKAKIEIANNRNQILSLTHIGVILAFFLYGITGWAPLSDIMLPYLLFFTFFAVKYRNLKML